MALSVTKHVYAKLAANEDLAAIVGTRIYPVNIPEGADKLPFVIFDTQTGQPDYCKDGTPEDQHTVTVYVIARNYMSELLPAAEAVRAALEGVTAEYDGYAVTSSEMQGAIDGWDDQLQAYLYTLTFGMTSC